MTDQIIQGTPSAVLLPARNYVFKVTDQFYNIVLPRYGKYHDLAPDFFKEDDGEFNILDEDSKVLFMPAVTKVLFAIGKYPDLKFNQFFVITSFKIEENEVSIVGQVIELLVATAEKAPKEE